MEGANAWGARDAHNGADSGRGPLPLERFRVFHSHDVDEARDFVARIFCPHELAPLHRDMALDACHHNAPLLRHASLNYVQYGAAVRIEPGFLQDFYLLQIPLRGGASVRCGAQQVESHRLLASLPSPTEALSMRWAADSGQLIVKMDRDAMRLRLEALLQAPLREPLVFELGADLAAPSAQGVLGFIAHLRLLLDGTDGAQFGSGLHGGLLVQAHGGLLERAALAEQAENHLLTSVLLSLRHNHSAQLDANAASQVQRTLITAVLPRSVRRAQEYLRFHAAAPITLADCCTHVGVSARALQVAFQRHVGMGPMAFLRGVRLDCVRRELLAGFDGTAAVSHTERAALVTHAALSYGFLHLGHFAARYRERFGEAPSATLQRARESA